MLTILNQTGYQINIEDIIGVEVPGGQKQKINHWNKKNSESLHLIIPEERWSATHLPAIAEQVAKKTRIQCSNSRSNNNSWYKSNMEKSLWIISIIKSFMASSITLWFTNLSRKKKSYS